MGKLPARIESLAQTPDGTLWMGTDAGLQRFDGVRFQPWTPPAGPKMTSQYVTALAAAADGGLWIGTRDGLSHWKDGKLENYRTSQGSRGPGVTSILLDRAGNVWAGTAGYQSGAVCAGLRIRLCTVTPIRTTCPGSVCSPCSRMARTASGPAASDCAVGKVQCREPAC